MRRFLLVYVLAASVFSFCAVFVPFTPGPEITAWFTDSSGRFMVVLPVGVLLMILILPVAAVVFLFNSLRPKPKQSEMLLDRTSIVVHRDKSLYGAVFAMDVIVNGQKSGSVMVGNSIRLEVPQGEHQLQVKAMGKATDPIEIQVSENTANEFRVGFKMGGSMQNIYILPVSH